MLGGGYHVMVLTGRYGSVAYGPGLAPVDGSVKPNVKLQSGFSLFSFRPAAPAPTPELVLN